MDAYHVYTDGSFRRPNIGAYGALILDPDETEVIAELSELVMDTTNNVMELAGVNRALKCFSKRSTIHFFCDSKYVINALTWWYKSWETRNWVNIQGTPVSNQDIIKETLELLKCHDVTFTHVYGHRGNRWNDEIDNVVRGLTKKKQIEIERGGGQ